MKRLKYILLIFLLISNVYAQDYSKSVGRFLLLGGGARAGALGSAYSAVAEDATTIVWNPAGLGAVKSFEFSFMHMMYGKDISFEYAASTIPLDFGTFGLNFIYLGMEPLAHFEDGELTGLNVDYYDMAVSLAFGKEFFNTYGFGLTTKYIKSAMGIKDTPKYYNAQGFAIDCGLIARFDILKFYKSAEKNLRIGAAVQNITLQKLKYIEGEFPFPMVIRPGFYYKPIKYSALMFDYNIISDSPNTINAGIEILPEWLLSPRAGIKIKDKLKTFTFGGGLNYGIGTFLLQFDYA